MTAKTRQLTLKEEAFAREYLASRSPIQAYRAAYGPNGSDHTASSNASHILKRPHVQAYIASHQAVVAEHVAQRTAGVLTEHFVQREYLAIAQAHLGQFMEWVYPKKRGARPYLRLRDPRQITEEMWRAVREFVLLPDGAVKIYFHDKRGALRDIASMLGLFPKGGGGPSETELPPPPGGEPVADDLEVQRAAVRAELQRNLAKVAKPIVTLDEDGQPI